MVETRRRRQQPTERLHPLLLGQRRGRLHLRHRLGQLLLGPAGPCTDMSTVADRCSPHRRACPGPGGPEVYSLPRRGAHRQTRHGLRGLAGDDDRLPLLRHPAHVPGRPELPAQRRRPPTPALTPPSPPRRRPPARPARTRAGPRLDTGRSARTAASSASVARSSTARPAASTSTSPWWAWRRRPTAGGYWPVASDGGVFAYGDARVLRLDGQHQVEQTDHRPHRHPQRWGLLADRQRRRRVRLRQRRVLRLAAGDGSASPVTAAAAASSAAAIGSSTPTARSSPSATPGTRASPVDAGGYRIAGMAGTRLNGYWLASANGDVADSATPRPTAP